MVNKREISRRDFIRMAGLTAAGATLAACGQQATTTPEAVATQAPAAPEIKEVIHWSWLSASDAAVWAELIKSYNEANPGLQIVQLDVPSDQYTTKILATAAAGQAPDFGNATGGTQAQLIDKKVLVPMDDHFKQVGLDINDFTDIAQADCRYPQWPNQLWHMPVDAMSFQLEINLDHAMEAGLDPDKPPTTGEELLEWAKAMTKMEGDKVVRSGFLMTGSGIHANYIWSWAAHQMGFRTVSDDLKQVAINPEAAKEAAQWTVDLFDKHKVSSRDVTDRYKAFGTGEGSMFISGPWTLNGYVEAGLNFMTVIVPLVGKDLTTRRSIGTLSMYVQENDARYTATAKALKWLSDNDWVWTTKGRGASCRKTTLAKAGYQEAGHPWKVRGAFIDGMQYAIDGPVKLKNAADFTYYGGTNLVHRTMDPVWLGQQDPSSAFDTLVAEWKKLIATE